METRKSKKVKVTTIVLLAGALVLSAATPVLSAILVQNFTQWTVTVDTPPINKVAGADDALTSYLTVNLGSTISNNDQLDSTPGTDNTYLSHEEIDFTCFAGDRTYYTDVLQLVNTTAASWDVTLTVEADLAGNAAVSDTFTAGHGDIWLFTSSADSTTALTSVPNPGLYGTLTDWYDSAAPNGAIQLEVNAGTLSVAGGGVTGPITIPATEQRQLALVVDCGDDMVNGETGTFRLTVAADPT